jgi:hypothetical protein
LGIKSGFALTGKERFPGYQIGSVEAFGETPINWPQQRMGLTRSVLLMQQTGEAGCGAQLKYLRALSLCDGERKMIALLGRGSVPEIIDEGLTGFIVEDETSAVSAVGRLSALSRPAIRKQFETRFTAHRMALDYLAAYRGLMEAAKPRIKLVSSAE